MGSWLLTDFDDSLAVFEGQDQGRQGALECGEEDLLSAVTQTHPCECARGARLIGEMEEILVLADQCATLGYRVMPNFRVARLVHFEADDVLGVVPMGIEESSQGGGELVIDQELHEA